MNLTYIKLGKKNKAYSSSIVNATPSPRQKNLMSMNIFQRFLRTVPIATAVESSLKDGYGFTQFKADLIAGIVVSLVALPLSMALSIAVGLPPQNGLYTAIVAGIVAALFGGSKTQVSGPTAAFVVIVAPIVAEFGLRGIIWCQILAGIILLVLGIARLGKIITYVPYPVTTGFTTGIAVVIGTIALNDFLGVAPAPAGHWPQKFMALLSYLPNTNMYALGVGVFAFAIMIGLPKFFPKIPSAIVGIVAATFLSLFLHRHGIDLETIGSRFSYTDLLGNSHQGVPPYMPALHVPGLSQDPVFALPTFQELYIWFMPAVIIAALAGLESLLSATVADSMVGTRHNPNAELNGIGLANIASGLFMGIPATGAIARTATNINAGAVSPLASIIHAFLLLAFMVLLAPFIAHIPMTALSSLLLVTAWRMSHAKHFVHLLKTAPKSDSAVLLLCFVLTVMVDMVVGVTTGIVLAIVLFLKRIINTTEVAFHDTESNQSECILPKGTALIRYEGPLFFGTANKAFDMKEEFLSSNLDHIIFDLSRVPFMDATAINMLDESLRAALEKYPRISVCADSSTMKQIRKSLNVQMMSHLHFHGLVDEALTALS